MSEGLAEKIAQRISKETGREVEVIVQRETDTEENEVAPRIEEILTRLRESREPMIKRRRKAVDRFFDALAGIRSRRTRVATEEQLLRENEELTVGLKRRRKKRKIRIVLLGVVSEQRKTAETEP